MPVTRSISSGTGAAAQGDSSPAVAVREHRGQPQHELAHCSDDLHGDPEQFEPQRRDLWARRGGPVRDEPQLLQQHVGRGGEQHEQLVGERKRVQLVRSTATSNSSLMRFSASPRRQ